MTEFSVLQLNVEPEIHHLMMMIYAFDISEFDGQFTDQEPSYYANIRSHQYFQQIAEVLFPSGMDYYKSSIHLFEAGYVSSPKIGAYQELGELTTKWHSKPTWKALWWYWINYKSESPTSVMKRMWLLIEEIEAKKFIDGANKI